eukprot:7786102-Alexandrium_andersonii.AAC.1
MAPQVAYSGMAHHAAADPIADDLGVPFLAADSSGQDLMIAAAHELAPPLPRHLGERDSVRAREAPRKRALGRGYPSGFRTDGRLGRSRPN